MRNYIVVWILVIFVLLFNYSMLVNTRHLFNFHTMSIMEVESHWCGKVNALFYFIFEMLYTKIVLFYHHCGFGPCWFQIQYVKKRYRSSSEHVFGSFVLCQNREFCLNLTSKISQLRKYENHLIFYYRTVFLVEGRIRYRIRTRGTR